MAIHLQISSQAVSGTGSWTASGAQQSAVNPRLVKAAHEFEGEMMKELLQPMTEGDCLGGDQDDGAGSGSGLGLGSGSGSGGALSEFASESLGQALSQRGGFGIADQIIRELSHNGNRQGTGKVTDDLHGNTVMRSSK
jgi:Rod binding domain-containing protein